jgi:hypothetical protein
MSTAERDATICYLTPQRVDIAGLADFVPDSAGKSTGWVSAAIRSR